MLESLWNLLRRLTTPAADAKPIDTRPHNWRPIDNLPCFRPRDPDVLQTSTRQAPAHREMEHL